MPRPVAIAVAILLLCLAVYRIFQPLPDPRRLPLEAGGPFRVERVIDGDTLLLEGNRRVRLIGVDTPETKHPQRPPEPLGFEASEFTRRHVENREVLLRFDERRYDRFDRILAYVFVDDWFLNEELIRAGYSRAETRFRYSDDMKRRFLAAEEEARRHGRGIWGLDERSAPGRVSAPVDRNPRFDERRAGSPVPVTGDR